MCKKKIYLFAIVATTISLFYGCSSTKNISKPETPRILPKFDYAPKNLAKVGSSNITIALVSPTYGDANLSFAPFEDMRKSMANDFEELLTSKGFKVRGPFNQIGEMLYNDKENSDFIFLVEIDLNFKNIERKFKYDQKTNWGTFLLTNSDGISSWFTYSGVGTFSCNLTLTATSSKFGEKLWKKNITMPAIPMKYQGEKHWDNTNITLYEEVMLDNAVYNEVAKVLEIQYQAVLGLVEKQVEVEEMKTVATEAHKVDKKQ